MRNMKIKKTGRWRRRIKWAIPIGILLIVAMTMAANYTVEYATDSLVYKEPASIPYNKVGLLLGTSKTLRSVILISISGTGYRLLLLSLKHGK